MKDIEKAKRIFDQVADLPAAERAAFLASCACDGEVRTHVNRMLEEFESGASFEDVYVAGPVSRSVGLDEFSDFGGTGRFIARRRLGSGAFGTVYEAYDKEQNSTIALKLLRRCTPDVLLRFKREFRSLVHVRHDNLVHLYELISEGGRWFFTMELVEGLDFIDYVRPNNGPCDYSRLRGAVRQLVGAVHALHSAKKLHRDLKPANVLVTSAGRVVVLDFGLVKELQEVIADRAVSLVGTPAYMSPEQSERLPLGPASDWYSVGVMLFQALTGRLPHSSSLVQRWIHDSDNRCLADAGILDSDVPTDLGDLCRQLLNRRPEERPGGDDVLGMIAGQEQFKTNEQLEGTRNRSEIFVGRLNEMSALQSAFVDTLSGGLSIVLIDGKSGIGKSAFVRHFLGQLQNTHANLLALVGRCYEFESVPYKGLDALVDELTQHLERLPESKREALLPREAFLLPRLFPVLGRIKTIEVSPVPSRTVPDAQELRQRTFAALRELFARIADRQPVVVWIDDLQWADRDSTSFLAELCAPPLQPPLLLLLTYRSEEIASNPTLQYLHNMIGNQPIATNWRHLSLSGLARDESLALLTNLLGPDSKEQVAAKIVDEAQGHPLFLQELARFANSSNSALSADRTDLELKVFLRRRVEELPSGAREMLELISIALQPISVPALFAASTGSPKDVRLESLGQLIRENLVRTTAGSDSEKRAEPFHDQVRSVVVDSLTLEVRKKRHSQLAKALSSLPTAEADALVTHYKEAGELRAAFEAALIAAEGAERQLAFDRAAMFYESALSTECAEDGRKRNLIIKLAESLGKAGRGRDAAQTYLSAAAKSGQESFEMCRLAADQFMRSGYIDEAMKLFRELARQIGIKAPTSPRAAVRSMVLGRLQARLRLIRGSPAPVAKCRPTDIALLELLRTGGLILGSTDSVLAAHFQVKYVCEALRVREAKHLAVALGIESSVRVAPGSAHPKNALALLQKAQELAIGTGDPNTIGTLHLLQAYVDYLLGKVPEGIQDSCRAIAFFRERCTGVAWEIAAAHILLLFFRCWSGAVGEVRNTLPQLLREGAARGDVNVQVSFRLLTYAHYYYLADDYAERCLIENREALDRWSSHGFHLQHYGALFSEVECHLYMGNYAKAREHLLRMWQPLSQSFILRWRILTVMALFLRGRVALACWLKARRDRALSAEVEYYAKRLDRISFPWCGPMACVLRGGLAAGMGRTPDAIRFFEEASNKFEGISLHTYAAAALHVCGTLRGGDQGRKQMVRAIEFLNSEQVRNPHAFLRMLIPDASSP